MREVSALLPGDYNVACSTQFGGYYKGMYTGDQEWAKELSVKIGLSDEQVEKVLKMGLIAQGRTADEAKLAHDPKNVQVVRKEDLSLEVTAIVPPNETVKGMYAAVNDPELKPIGSIKARYWVNPFAVAEDVSDDGEEETDPFRTEELEIYLEEEILEKVFVGMKFEGVVCQVHIGEQSAAVENGENANGKGEGEGYTLLFIDRVWAVYCSFYTNLPNEMMIGWKKPAPLQRGSKKRGVMGGGGMEQGEQQDGVEGLVDGEEGDDALGEEGEKKG